MFSEDFTEDDAVWSYSEIKKTSFEVTDTVALHDLILDVEHSKDFQFQNLYFKIYTSFPSGNEDVQTLPVNLADKLGKWYGRCGKKTCTVRINLQSQIHFTELGTYTLQFEQNSREKDLEGIHGLSFKLF